jgi:hypothetical protein
MDRATGDFGKFGLDLRANLIADILVGDEVDPAILSWTPKMRQVAKVEPCP